jgi:hypothetical protein
MKLSIAQDVTVTLIRLNTAGQIPFVVVGLGGYTSISMDTPAEAEALRDAFQRAADMLSAAEGGTP